MSILDKWFLTYQTSIFEIFILHNTVQSTLANQRYFHINTIVKRTICTTHRLYILYPLSHSLSLPLSPSRWTQFHPQCDCWPLTLPNTNIPVYIFSIYTYTLPLHRFVPAPVLSFYNYKKKKNNLSTQTQNTELMKSYLWKRIDLWCI